MFTGIIQELGIINKITNTEKSAIFFVKCKKVVIEKSIGDSIAVNGACVTVIEINADGFQFEAIKETLEKTNFKNLKEGDHVNLEPALKLSQSLDGHIVQGHVDTEGLVLSLNQEGDRNTLTIKFPSDISPYLAEKGSITIDGVSLTIATLKNNIFTVELISHTLKETNFQYLKAGDKVNLEVDIIARYLKRLIQNHGTG